MYMQELKGITVSDLKKDSVHQGDVPKRESPSLLFFFSVTHHNPPTKCLLYLTLTTLSGCVIWGKLAAPACKGTSVMTIFEDQNGEVYD